MVTIKLHSATTASEFFSQLELAPAVDEIDIELKWEFGPPDIKQMVRAIQKSNIRFCSINLNDSKERNYSERLQGRGRYETLMEQISMTKVKSVYLSGLDYFGKCSTNFANGTICSTLTQFEYADCISAEVSTRKGLPTACRLPTPS